MPPSSRKRPRGKFWIIHCFLRYSSYWQAESWVWDLCLLRLRISRVLGHPLQSVLRQLTKTVSLWSPAIVTSHRLLLEGNACRMGFEVFHKIYRFATFEWIVDDNTIQLLHNDLQILMDCTRPGERVVFSNKRTLKLTRTLRITNKLEFIGKPLSVSESCHAEEMIPSLRCPFSESALSIE